MKKKMIAIVVGSCMMFGVRATICNAGGHNWEYWPNEDYGYGLSVMLADPNVAGHVAIPDYLDGQPVVDVEMVSCIYCFYPVDGDFRYITSVSVPDTVRRIGVQAFGGQYQLGSVVLPASLEVIGVAAFQDCRGPFSFKGDRPEVYFPSWYDGEDTPFGTRAQAANAICYFVEGRAGWVNNGKWYGATTKCYPGTELVKGVMATQGVYLGRVRVSWNAVSGNTKGYDIYRTYTDIPTGAYQFIGNVGCNVTTFDDTTSGTHTCIYVVVPAGFAQLIGVQNLMATGLPFNTARGWAKVQSLYEALGSPDGEIATGGDENWAADVGSARSGAIEDDMSSWLELTVDGAGRLEFDCKVSSETSYDKLSYHVDGKYAGDISGDKGWIHVARIIDGPKKHVVRWTYSKDQSVSDGMDCGWLRNVKWSPVRPHEIRFDPNGGSCEVTGAMVTEGKEVGDFLPWAWRKEFEFLGWYTAREGGARVTAATVMVGYDVTLYAHWEATAFGSHSGKPVPFEFSPRVATYSVALAKEWLADEGRYDEASGVLYCKSSVARGKVYTIALPVGQDYEVACVDAGAIVEYAAYGALRYCVVDARDLSEETAELALSLFGAAGARTTVYVVEGNLVPVGAEYEEPDPGDLPGSCPGRATGLEFGAGVRARTVRLVHEWDEMGERYIDGGVRYLAAVAPTSGRLTVAVPASQAEGCAVTCAGAAASSEEFAGVAFWIFDAQAGDEVLVALSGARGADATVYTFGGDYLAKKLVFDPNGGTCPVESKEVRAGVPVGELPAPDARAGHVFLGWYTAREGGVRVTAATVMVGSDVTLCAHWERLAAGSCQEAAIPFAMTTSVAAYPVSLAREWLEDELKYSDADGAFYCRTTLRRGKVYTMAVPKGLDQVNAWCVNGEASVTSGSDASLQYVRFDTTQMAAEETEAYFAVFCEVGQRTTVYAVEADVMPKD